MGNLIQDVSEKLKELSLLFQNKLQLQYTALALYLLLWLITTGSLSTTIWVVVGVGLGWMIGRGSKYTS